MIKREHSHFTEEELLMHLLDEEAPDAGIAISSHLPACRSCSAVFNELAETVKAIRSWAVEEPPEERWQSLNTQIQEQIHRDSSLLRSRRIIGSVFDAFRLAWDYSLERPLPAVSLIGVVIAFASARAVEFFRLQHMLPSAGQVIEVLRQVL